MNRFLLLAALLPLVGCPDSPAASPTSPNGGAAPDVVGTYSSEEFVSGSVTRESDGTSFSATCPGFLVVESQNGSSIAGSAQAGGQCGDARVDFTGEVGGDGSASLSSEAVGLVDPEALGCTVAGELPTELRASFSSTFEAEFQIAATCTVSGETDDYVLEARLFGNRE